MPDEPQQDPPANGPSTLAPGVRLGPYQVTGSLGAGGMGEVYRATDTRLHRTVAIKVLPGVLAGNPGFRERFELEARAVSSLNHPHICVLHDIGESGGVSFLVMEFLEGESLAARLRQGRLPTGQICRYAIQIADALDAAHAKGIIHRDIKPANIFLTNRGSVKVLDFGLAKLTQPSSALESSDRQVPVLTSPGMIMGTPAYMSPEQAAGEETDTRTDLYSFGSVLYEMATGELPFVGNTGVVLAGVLTRDPIPAQQLNPDLPSGLVRIIDRLMRKDRALRYQSASEVLADLEALTVSTPGRSADLGTWKLPGSGTAATSRPGRVKYLVAAAAGIAAAVGTYLLWHNKPVLTERDSIVLADFGNSTADVVFDGSLRQALSVKLAESPFLDLLSEDKVARTLQMMQQPRNVPLTLAVAREVCQRNGLKAVVEGSIARLGNTYAIQLNAVNCANGDSLARAGIEADGKDTVLRQLGKAAVELRGKLGESLSSVRRFDQPFEATSSSLEALRLYTMAVKLRQDGKIFDEISLLQRAVELDRNFAVGYAALSGEYWNLRQTDKAAAYGKRGFDLRDTVTEREKFILLDRYYGNVLGDLDKLIESDKLWTLIYPRDYAAFAALGSAYGKAGQRDQGLEATLQAIRLNPDTVAAYVNAMGQYAASGRFSEARQIYEQARKRSLAYQRLAVFLYDVAFLQHDDAAMAQAAREAATRQGGQDDILVEQALVEAYSGRRKRARELLSRAIESAERRDDGSALGILFATLAHIDALFGEFTGARRDAAQALKRSSARNVLAVASWALARAGDRNGALPGEQQLQRDYATDTIARRVYLPALRAERELAANQPEHAIEELRPSIPYELASSAAPTSVMYVVYLRGEAYLRMRQGGMAAAEFEKIIQHPGIVVNSPLASLARFGAAQAYALSGDVGKSRGAFEELFRVWKNADGDLPVLLDARRHYARLQ